MMLSCNDMNVHAFIVIQNSNLGQNKPFVSYTDVFDLIDV